MTTTRDRTASENMGLVHSIAQRFKGRGIEYDDLVGAGFYKSRDSQKQRFTKKQRTRIIKKVGKYAVGFPACRNFTEILIRYGFLPAAFI